MQEVMCKETILSLNEISQRFLRGSFGSREDLCAKTLTVAILKAFFALLVCVCYLHLIFKD